MRNKVNVNILFCVVGLLFLLSSINNSNTELMAELVASDSIRILSDADFITFGFPGTGTVEDPYIIENYDVYSTDINTEGIYVFNTTKYFVILNNEVTHSFYGILIQEVAPGTGKVLDNRCYKCKHDGLGIKESSGILISGNTFENSATATGLVIDNCTDIILTNNVISGSPISGCGMYASSNLTISRNTFRDNAYKGITASSVCDSYFYENLFESNGEYGLELTETSIENVVYHNNFIDNFPGGMSQARDSSGNNVWYNEALLEGSYWSDYSGIGSYSIEGASGCCDMYPLSEPLNLDEEEPNETSFTYLLVTFLFLPIIYSIRRKRE
jgi:parallel beta-helix repeat protein